MRNPIDNRDPRQDSRRHAARIYASQGFIRAAIRVLRGEVDHWTTVRFCEHFRTAMSG